MCKTNCSNIGGGDDGSNSGSNGCRGGANGSGYASERGDCSHGKSGGCSRDNPGSFDNHEGCFGCCISAFDDHNSGCGDPGGGSDTPKMVSSTPAMVPMTWRWF